ncbi:hypothetical protein GCM10023258_23360 [Terrabacter aeriphilus]|uniref:Uncharacterized protein n=1 Tax=Terrabacter aeriphilus TaxID=515662 RepID=A0ABP9JCW0_9MICO
MVGGKVGDRRGVAAAEPGRETGEQDDKQGDQGDDGAHQGKPSLGKAEISDGDEHADGFLSQCPGWGACLVVGVEVGSGVCRGLRR